MGSSNIYTRMCVWSGGRSGSHTVQCHTGYVCRGGAVCLHTSAPRTWGKGTPRAAYAYIVYNLQLSIHKGPTNAVHAIWRAASRVKGRPEAVAGAALRLAAAAGARGCDALDHPAV